MSNSPWPRRIMHIAGYTIVLGIGIGIGAAGDSEEPASAQPAPTVTTTVDPAPTATVTAEATVTAAPPAPAAAITDGVWLVGEDIEPGTYRTIEAVSGDGSFHLSPPLKID